MYPSGWFSRSVPWNSKYSSTPVIPGTRTHGHDPVNAVIGCLCCRWRRRPYFTSFLSQRRHWPFLQFLSPRAALSPPARVVTVQRDLQRSNRSPQPSCASSFFQRCRLHPPGSTTCASLHCHSCLSTVIPASPPSSPPLPCHPRESGDPCGLAASHAPLVTPASLHPTVIPASPPSSLPLHRHPCLSTVIPAKAGIHAADQRVKRQATSCFFALPEVILLASF